MIEDIFIFPFVVLGRIIAAARPLPKQYTIFYFFPFYHTGGAEKVHAQIINAAGDSDCIIFFTRRSGNSRFYEEFKKSGCTIKDISKYCDNKWLYFLNLIYRGIITGYINKQKMKPAVFNGQSNFGYKISPWVKKGIRQIELIHSLNSFSYIRIPFIPFITDTVMISEKRIEDHKVLYQRYKIPVSYFSKIQHLPNAIKLPGSGHATKNEQPFIVLYAGRGGIEKRVHLVAKMAAALNKTNPGIQFEMLGDVSSVIDEKKYTFIKFYGNVDNENVIQSIYEKAHVLVITSSTEGFPMVLMEAMANSCAILATPVGDIPLHIKNSVNGYLFSSVNDEKMIVTEGIKTIQEWEKNREEINTIASNNTSYAKHNFSIEKFNSAWQQLLNKPIN